MWLYTGRGNPTATDVIGIVALSVAEIVVGFVVLRWWKMRRPGPLLATLQTSDLRITHGAVRDATTNAMSGKQLVFAGASSTFAATAALVNGAIQIATGQLIGLFWLALGLVFVGLAVYY
jgi:hypothetical protein